MIFDPEQLCQHPAGFDCWKCSQGRFTPDRKLISMFRCGDARNYYDVTDAEGKAYRVCYECHQVAITGNKWGDKR